MIRPTRVEPIKLMRLTAGCSIRVSMIAGASSVALVITFMTPAGCPASRSASAISKCVFGLSSDARNTTVLPQTSG